MIECRTFYGHRKPIPKESLVFRPSVYAVIVDQAELLVVQNRMTGKYFLPGGGVEIGEPVQTALHREMREETGCAITIREFLRFTESFFYCDPLDEAYHSLLFFYHCTLTPTPHPTEFHIEDTAETLAVRWLPLQHVQETDFQDHGAFILDLLTPFSTQNNVNEASTFIDSSCKSIRR